MKTAPNKKINKLNITERLRTCLLIQGYKSVNPHSLLFPIIIKKEICQNTDLLRLSYDMDVR